MADNNNLSFGESLGLSAASAVFNTIGNMATAEITSRKSLKYTKQLLAEQEKYRKAAFQDSLDFWNKQVEYESPTNQAARLRSAGISPLSQFSGSGTPGLSSVSGVDASQFQVDGARLPLMDFAELALQKQAVDAEVNLKDAQAEYYRENAQGQRNENSLFDLTRRIREAGAISAEQQARQDTLDTEFSEWNQDNRKRLSEETLANFETQRNKMNQEISESVSREASNMMGIREAFSRIMLNNAQVALVKSNIRLNNSQINKISKEIEKIASDISETDARKLVLKAQENSFNQDVQKKMRDNKIWDAVYDYDGDGKLDGSTVKFLGYERLLNIFKGWL